MKKTAIGFVALCLLLACPVFGSAGPTSAEGKPDSLDIYDPRLGDFLSTDVNALDKQANDAYQSGKYEEAARCYLTALKCDIADANSIYNLACCYGLLHKDTLAALYLERASKAGFDNIAYAKRDPDFDSVRSKPVFTSTVNRLDSAAGAREQGLGNVLFFDAPTFLRCRVHLPANYDSTQSYPLVIGLHGLGGSLNQFITLWKRFGDSSFIFATPQAPYPYTGGTEIGYSWSTGTDSGSRKQAATLSEDYVARVTQKLKDRYRPSRAYLLGFSQGCAMTYRAGIRNHELYHGLLCFGGWLDTSDLRPQEIQAAKGLRVFIGHGKQDRTVDYKGGEEARDVLKQYGYDVTFKDFDGGHTVDAGVLKQTVVWMKK